MILLQSGRDVILWKEEGRRHYNPAVNPIFFLSIGLLAAFFVVVSVWTWRVVMGRRVAPPLVVLAITAVIFGLTGWQAVGWLRGDHADATQIRYVAVWLQLLGAFGITGLMIVMSAFGRPRRAS